MTEELELRYSIDDPAAVEAWLDEHLWPADWAKRGDWRDVRHIDRYFDTADGALARAGYGARLRTADGRTWLTLKSDIGRSGALHRRREIEAEAAASLDPATWPVSDAQRLVRLLAADKPLVERFTIDQRRRVREARRAGSVVQVSIDRLAVEHGGRLVERQAILELELRDGGEAALGELDTVLASSGLVRPEPSSKMQLAEQHVRSQR